MLVSAKDCVRDAFIVLFVRSVRLFIMSEQLATLEL